MKFCRVTFLCRELFPVYWRVARLRFLPCLRVRQAKLVFRCRLLLLTSCSSPACTPSCPTLPSFADGEAAAQGLTTQPQIFAGAIANFLSVIGLPHSLVFTLINLAVSAFALTSLDSVARIGRMSFQELFLGDTTDTAKMTPVQRVLTNKYFATVITLFFGYLLTLGGYNNVWPLFGSANQLLAALVLIALAVFLKTTGRTGWTLYIPMFAMLAVTFTALIQKTIALVKNIAGGQATFLVDGLQFIVAVLLMVLGVLVAFSCLKKLFGKNRAGQAA